MFCDDGVTANDGGWIITGWKNVRSFNLIHIIRTSTNDVMIFGGEVEKSS